MKINSLIEGRSWNGNAWVGGASDEGHADFDPSQQANGGYRGRPQNRRQTAPRAQEVTVGFRVPFQNKDALKAACGGRARWEPTTKTWQIPNSVLTPELYDKLAQLQAEVVDTPTA